MATQRSNVEKVKTIFQHFDTNRDGGLNHREMSALVVAINPKVQFTHAQITAIVDDVFQTYQDFVNGAKGLTFNGLLRSYDDGAGDVDRDFDAIVEGDDNVGISRASEEELVMEEPLNKKHLGAAAWATSPNHGVVFDGTQKLVDDLEVLIKTLRLKQSKDGKGNSGVLSDPGWSREIGPSAEDKETRVVWDESGRDYADFVKKLGALSSRANRAKSRLEAFDGQMAIGRVLFDHFLMKEALVSFNRASELIPINVKPHFDAGNCLYMLGRYTESKEEFLLALEAAEAGGNQWAYLLPQIHVNLGIVLESEGMVLSACEHYREAAILCPTHFRAFKLLGSALLGVGDYKAAVKALEEASYMKSDYADAHCDLASALHAMGNYDYAIKEFQKAIDLRPSNVDALYNLGGLYMDMGRYQRASDMFTRVLNLSPNHWRARINKAASLLGVGETEEAEKSLKEALRVTAMVELHDASSYLKQLQRRKLRGNDNSEAAFITVEASKFKTVGENTTSRPELAAALDIRAFQRITRLSQCEVELIKKEMSEADVPVSYSGSGLPEKLVRIDYLEGILRKLLSFLKPETFVEAVKAMNQNILSLLNESGADRVDLGMFFAVLAPLCGGPIDRRKQSAYESLLWMPLNEGNTQLKKSEVQRYLHLLRAIYMPSNGTSLISQVLANDNDSAISLSEFSKMFDDHESGFGILSTLLNLENEDRNRHGSLVCATCSYPITGLRFKEMKSQFSLCSACYSEGKVPSTCKQEEYRFKEYANEVEALKDKCLWFSSKVANAGGL